MHTPAAIVNLSQPFLKAAKKIMPKHIWAQFPKAVRDRADAPDEQKPRSKPRANFKQQRAFKLPNGKKVQVHASGGSKRNTKRKPSKVSFQCCMVQPTVVTTECVSHLQKPGGNTVPFGCCSMKFADFRGKRPARITTGGRVITAPRPAPTPDANIQGNTDIPQNVAPLANVDTNTIRWESRRTINARRETDLDRLMNDVDEDLPEVETTPSAPTDVNYDSGLHLIRSAVVNRFYFAALRYAMVFYDKKGDMKQVAVLRNLYIVGGASQSNVHAPRLALFDRVSRKMQCKVLARAVKLLRLRAASKATRAERAFSKAARLVAEAKAVVNAQQQAAAIMAGDEYPSDYSGDGPNSTAAVGPGDYFNTCDKDAGGFQHHH